MAGIVGRLMALATGEVRRIGQGRPGLGIAMQRAAGGCGWCKLLRRRQRDRKTSAGRAYFWRLEASRPSGGPRYPIPDISEESILDADEDAEEDAGFDGSSVYYAYPLLSLGAFASAFRVCYTIVGWFLPCRNRPRRPRSQKIVVLSTWMNRAKESPPLLMGNSHVFDSYYNIV
ncbi:hypothetical protein C8J57DRAFT_1287715 [Mycena rebaudengoi]|nr:hypothetical protein C8J57DRAFT_1287715 [Mycena rebaudengoi]